MSDIKRDVSRSSMTNYLAEYLYSTVRCRICIEHPELGMIRLTPEMAREFLWSVRGHRADELVPDFLKRLRKNFMFYMNIKDPEETQASEAVQNEL